MTGTLADTTPASVLQVLSSRGSTGAVRFLGDRGCTVYLYQGELYFAENDDTAEDLSVALVRPDRLAPDQWDSATQSGYPTDTVGEELIQTGAITGELLASVVLSVIYDPLIALFRAPVGDYEFAPDVLHWIGPYRTFEVDAVVAEVRRRTREADEMSPVIPSLDVLVRSARILPEQHGSVNLRRDEWEVVVAAASGCTVAELAVQLGRGRWSTARIVYRLASADLLTITREDADASSGLTTRTAAPPIEDPVGATATTDGAGMIPLPDPDPADPGDIDGRVEDPWAIEDDPLGSGPADPWSTPLDDGMNGEGAVAGTTDWTGGLTAVPDATEEPVGDDEFGVPELHPDIAKALAESTYADSATAINAMAARLGALEDEEDDWDSGAADGESGDDFWSSEVGVAEHDDFIWKPAVWDTGIESAPLPQREGARATVQREAGDPAWLDDLYNEFMPGDQPTPDPGAATAAAKETPKPRGLRRLLSAIRRL